MRLESFYHSKTLGFRLRANPLAYVISFQFHLSWNHDQKTTIRLLFMHIQSSAGSKIIDSSPYEEIRQKRNCSLQESHHPCPGGRNDIISWNTKITNYAREGRIEDARQLFDKMPERTVASWNAMISGYARNGRIDDAKCLFDTMPERNVISWTGIIAGYAQNGVIEEARQLFEIMPQRNAVSWNSMIAGYAQNGRMDDARDMFDKMPLRNVVSWNAMIAGYAQSGQIENAHKLFDRMPKRNEISWNAMITGYARNGRVGDAGQLFDKMPERSAHSCNAMIVVYAQHGRIEDAYQIFHEMSERNAVSWNAMITGFVDNGRLEDALKLFDKMPQRNVVSWTAMIMGYFQVGKIIEASHLFNKMPERDVASWNAMISGYALNGKMEDAQGVFDRMPERNVCSWNALIVGYAKNGHGEETLKLFVQMKQAGMKLDSSTFSSVLSSCASLAALEHGKQMHEQIIKIGVEPDLFVKNALITMYVKCGNIDDARQVFDKMAEQDLVSWNAIIGGHAQHGRSKETLQLFKKMQQAGVKPDHITFVGILSACSHGGLVDEGWHYFHSMSQEHCITPKEDHYTCMIDLLGRAGRLDEAEDFINNIPIKPNTSMWGALLGACRIHGNVESGKHAAECLFELEPQNPAPYVALSNIYAAAGRRDDVLKVRHMMKNRGVKKNPGCSWIEVKEKLHTFLVGDRSHPETQKIYETLGRLARQMKEADFVHNRIFAVSNVWDKHFIRHHSEMLAIAFGLISTPTGTRVRIIKNLRVCGSCHRATKFISKIVGRDIVVRDANRFHHFKDGFCSCGDYW